MMAPHASTAAALDLAQAPPARAERVVDVVTDTDTLLRMQPAWDRLMGASGVDHPFLSHEWIRSWWESFGGSASLRIVRVCDGGTLVGLLPLMWSREFRHGLPVRRLGSPYNAHTPRGGILVARDAHGVAEAIWRHLRRAQDWDVLELCQLAGDAAPLEPLRDLARADGFLTGAWQARPSPYVAIHGTWDDYCRNFDAKQRSSLRRRLQLLGQQGEVTVDLVSAGAGIAGALEDGFRIEAAAWKGSAGTAIAARPELRRFYAGLAERTAERGWLELQFLTLGGRRIAFAYSLRYRNRLFLLKPGYDPAYARYSPGSALTWLLLRNAFEQGLAEFDFLGVDDPWKRVWTPVARAHHWQFVFPATLRGRWLHAAKFRIAPALRRWTAS